MKGLLNIIDEHFDNLKGKYTPYVDNKEAGLISFFLNVYLYLKRTDRDNEVLNAYKKSINDCVDFLKEINKRRSNKLKFDNDKDLNEKLLNLYNIYSNRGNTYKELKTINNNGLNVQIYIIGEKDELLTLDGIERNIYTNFKETIKEETFVKYYIDGIYLDSNGEVLNNKDSLYMLFYMLKKSFEEDENHFDAYLKEYFYKKLVEKYRTLDIKEEIYGNRKSHNTSKSIPKIYSKFNGKSGTTRAYNCLNTAKKRSYNDEYKLVSMPFVKSEIKNGYMSFYIDKINLPESFNFLKNYKTIEDYFEHLASKFLKRYNTIDFANELLEYKNEFSHNKIKELLCYVRPYFNNDKDYIINKTSTDIDSGLDILSKVNGKDFEVVNFSDTNNSFVYGLKNTDDQMIISITSDKLKQLKYNRKLGSGYLNIKQLKYTLKDNLITNINKNKQKAYLKATKTNDEYTYEEIDLTLEDRDDYLNNQKVNGKYELTETFADNNLFENVFDDQEISISHFCNYCFDYDEENNWKFYTKNKDAKIEIDIPKNRRGKVFKTRNGYFLILPNNNLNDANTIKQLELIEEISGKSYQFPVEDVVEKICVVENNTLEFSNDNFDFSDGYVSNNELHLYLADSIVNGKTYVVRNGDLSVSEDEIIFTSKNGYTLINGDTMILGKEYNNDNFTISVKEEDGEFYLDIEEKENKNKNINIRLVEDKKYILKRAIKLRPCGNSDEFLEKLSLYPDNAPFDLTVDEEQSFSEGMVIVSNIVQGEGKDRFSHIPLNTLKYFYGIEKVNN